MGTQQQLGLIGAFEPNRPSNPIFCHQEFLEKLALQRNAEIGRRVAYLMQRLAVAPAALQADFWREPRLASVPPGRKPGESFLRLVGTQECSAAARGGRLSAGSRGRHIPPGYSPP